MGTRVEPRALWGRTGAIALPLGVVLLVASTAAHPSREDVMDHTAVFREYAQSDGWIAIHFTQWLAGLVFFGGLAALYFAMATKREGPTALARFGLAGVVLTAAAITMLQAVDGVALKWAVDAWTEAGVAWIIHGLMVHRVWRPWYSRPCGHLSWPTRLRTGQVRCAQEASAGRNVVPPSVDTTSPPGVAAQIDKLPSGPFAAATAWTTALIWPFRIQVAPASAE